MMPITQLRDYKDLLEIRRKGYRRHLILITGIFALILVAFVLYGLLSNPVGNSIYLESALVIMLGIIFANAWAKLEVMTGTLELLNNLQRMIETSSDKLP